MELEPFLAALLGIDSVQALIDANADSIRDGSKYALALQVIAEDLNLKITDEDLESFFIEITGSPDYSAYEEAYGRPYLAQAALSDKIGIYLADNAVLLDE